MFVLSSLSSAVLSAALPLTASLAPVVNTNTVAPTPLIVSPSFLAAQDFDTNTGGNFSYDYVEGGISLGEAVGTEIGFSHEVEGPWIAIGRFLYLTDDESGVDIDFFGLSGGVGYVHNLQTGLDLVGRAELEWGYVDASGNGVDDNDDEFGARVRGGARFAAMEDLEVFGNAGFRTIFDSDFVADFGAVYRLESNWSALGRVDIDDDTQFLLGVRYGF
ncbi:MAG: outer membrane beta-barrel protein [Planctomycetaceae bacterium]|nr:outer membrane beta-barrel protein [Planctomycetaceae bacterium]